MHVQLGQIKDKIQKDQTEEKTQLPFLWASLIAQLVKDPLAMWEIWVQSLDWEYPLEKEKAIHSSILAWRIPQTVQSMGHKEMDTTE